SPVSPTSKTATAESTTASRPMPTSSPRTSDCCTTYPRRWRATSTGTRGPATSDTTTPPPTAPPAACSSSATSEGPAPRQDQRSTSLVGTRTDLGCLAQTCATSSVSGTPSVCAMPCKVVI